MGFLDLAGSFIDLISGSSDKQEEELKRQAEQARFALAEKAKGMRADANMQAESVWSQGVSGSITDQAQYGIDSTERSIKQESDNLEQQIASKFDELKTQRIKQVFGFMVNIATTAAGVYSGASDITADMDRIKPDSKNYQRGEAGSALFLNDYSNWEKKRNIQYFKNLL